jgi:predicted metal-dependent hydrolase
MLKVLIMAHLAVVDYVVVYELLLLEEKNHSRIFWNKVGRLMPDYKKYQNRLKKNGHLLRL